MEEASELQEPPGLRRLAACRRISQERFPSRWVFGCPEPPPVPGRDMSPIRLLEAMRPERVGRRSATGSGRPPDPRPLRSKRQSLRACVVCG